MLFSVNFPPGNVGWVCMTQPVFFPGGSSFVEGNSRCHWMILHVHGSPPFFGWVWQTKVKNLVMPQKKQTTTKNWIFDFILKVPKTTVNMKKKRRPFGGAVEFQWSCWIIYLAQGWLSRTVGNCHNIWRTLCKLKMTMIMKMMTTVTRWLSQVFVGFTPTWGRRPIWRIYFRWVESINENWVVITGNSGQGKL